MKRQVTPKRMATAAELLLAGTWAGVMWATVFHSLTSLASLDELIRHPLEAMSVFDASIICLYASLISIYCVGDVSPRTSGATAILVLTATAVLYTASISEQTLLQALTASALVSPILFCGASVVKSRQDEPLSVSRMLLATTLTALVLSRLAYLLKYSNGN